MGYKNTSVTFKNANMHEAAKKQAANTGERNLSAYMERLIRADIIANGNEDVRKLVNTHDAA